MLFTFYRYLTFLLSRCRWIYLWSCWEGLIVAAHEGMFSNFYVCTKVFFFDIHEIARFAYFITQVDLHLLRWSLFVFHVLCRVKSLHCIPTFLGGTSEKTHPVKWCCLHFTTILTFLLSRCRWIYLWSCWEELIVAALEGRFSNLYVCTKVFFFDVHKIALFAYFITQVDLPLLRWSWMVPERTKMTFACLKCSM